VRRALAVVAVLAAAAVALRSLGRPWWCEAGDAVPWSWDVWSRHNSQHLLDPYTVTHAMHGVLAYGLLWLALGRVAAVPARAALALAGEVAWEVVENTDAMIERYRTTTLSLDYYGDSVVNSLGDVGAFVLGWAAASAVPAWTAAAAVVAAEAFLLLAIRDGLLLNVLMLVHPIDAVKAWQLGGSHG
jgi:hypothetical protein